MNARVETQQVGGIQGEAVEAVERLVIEQTVAQVFGIQNGDLRRATRGRAHVARARQVGMYLAHVACGRSLTDVGRLFARDRTTVSHACSVIEDGRDDPTFDHVLELLERAVLAMIPTRLGRPHNSDGWLVH
ncbi:MAG: helix-turn-helix domain-containing protein [Hyphomicrobiaceae bacterium]